MTNLPVDDCLPGRRWFTFARQRIATLSIIAMSMAITVTLSLGATPASAASGIGGDCTASHCYSASVIELYGQSPFEGAHIAMALLPMATGGANYSNGYQVGNTLWVVFGKDWSDNYIEAGLADGWAYPNGCTYGCRSADKDCMRWSYEAGNGGSSACYNSGCGAYFLYWEDHSVSGGVKCSYMHVVRFTSPTPSATQYIDIIHNYDGAGNWNVTSPVTTRMVARVRSMTRTTARTRSRRAERSTRQRRRSLRDDNHRYDRRMG